MSAAATPCSKFQANIFNKSKCQNCFKSRELHPLNDHDLEQAKPIYAGWLCLAPEGTDFNNPMQRSRRWQRRFFILYEDGSLSFALDELPSTLPQGTVNVNVCTDIFDAEPRTGQKNALCIVTPEQEVFIRGDNKDIINGWSEQLAVYLQTHKQNQKKKRKVEPVANQEPSPAKMVATDLSFPSSGRDRPEPGQWQEDQRDGGPDVTPIWTVTDTEPPGPERTPAGAAEETKQTHTQLSCLSANHSRFLSSRTILTQLFKSFKNCILYLLGLSLSCIKMYHISKLLVKNDGSNKQSQRTALPFSPDLLNFKKGWMVKLDENDQWKKYWFVLSTDSLRYYKDSMAEEASDLEGDIDLTKCYNVSEYQVQRNYGFQIHTPKGVVTLSAMTAGIRKNWIQALMKNVHPANAPDVLPKPDVTQDSPSADISLESDPHPKASSVTERRHEGRYRTFDWAEFKPESESVVDADPQKSPCSLELGDLERRKRREERRRRYEKMLAKLSNLEQQRTSKMSAGCQTDEIYLQDAELQSAQESEEEEEEELIDEMEIPQKVSDESLEESDEPDGNVELISSLRRKVEELEEQLMRPLCLQVTCERGLASMEESHLKVIEELQRRHKQEVERLLVERDRLLEEESAATATAIEAIKNAHRLELQREVQKRCEIENSNGLSHLEDVHRQHSEELASCQRELEVLSQQFSLKCLENGHLVQALDAERKALCQCQQENQDLRTRNQELSGHLAAEITRLCTLAKQDALPLSQGMDVYEMEITLRVKESEVQCLKQEITSLKDELQSAQRDKRNATKKYKDMYTELSIVRAKTEREADELRENLRLAHQALGRTSTQCAVKKTKKPKKHAKCTKKICETARPRKVNHVIERDHGI
uniref:Myosin phosphatase Rho-interacting protein n=1 Tax=Oreochromis niloticus TaxID=8128 RepID=A0A669CJE3_ORENI